MIKPIHTILVPLDLTEHGEAIVDWATELAKLKKARLILLHVLSPTRAYSAPAFVDPMSFDEQYARARNAARERLLPLAGRAQVSGVDTSVRVRVGLAPDQILEMTRDTEAGLIVLGTHGRRGLAHLVLGSTAEKVVQLAECPVFVVKEAPAGVTEKADETAAVPAMAG
jgi:nucleotide-binding universal stress UspA family protein